MLEQRFCNRLHLIFQSACYILLREMTYYRSHEKNKIKNKSYTNTYVHRTIYEKNNNNIGISMKEMDNTNAT